jgi:hypothetical protein
MTIFWHPTGPLIRYENGLLRIEDLNPEIKTRWRMTRRERFMTGLRFLLSAVYNK